MESGTILVATLGGQPQAVTFLLDLLLGRGEAVDRVEVLYLAPYRRSQAAFRRLAGEFSADRYQGRPCRFHGAPIRAGASDLTDIRTPDEVEAVRQNINQLLAGLKEQGASIHLGLGGGRRLMSLVALAAAMQYLTPADRLWHVYVPPEFDRLSSDGALMHAPPQAGVTLVAVPFVPWVAYFPGLSGLLKRSPQEIGETSLGWLEAADRARCRRVWEALTPRQKEVLQAFASGLSRQEVARRLGIAVTTVDSHRDSLLARCSLEWEGGAGEEFDARFLQRYFGPFLTGLDLVHPRTAPPS